MDKKLMAKKEMLKKLSKDIANEMKGPMRDGLKSKQEVKVVADSKEGLEEGLSKAMQILKKRSEMKGESSDSDEKSDKIAKLEKMKEMLEGEGEMCEACECAPCECEMEEEYSEEEE